MNPDLILLPALAQILLVVVLYVHLAAAKSQATQRGEVDESRRALYADAWPEPVIQINNCIRNQFEVPVLFYVLVVMLWMLQAVSALTLTLAWLFVATRLLHAWVHIGSNVVPVRRRLFSVGVLLLVALWVNALLAIVA